MPSLYTNEDLSWSHGTKKIKQTGREMEYMVFTVSLNIIINPHNREKIYIIYKLQTDIGIEIKKYVKVMQSVGRKLLYM